MPKRLQKLIAQAGIASRRQAEALIKVGEVSVNGEIISEYGTSKDFLIQFGLKNLSELPSIEDFEVLTIGI